MPFQVENVITPAACISLGDAQLTMEVIFMNVRVKACLFSLYLTVLGFCFSAYTVQAEEGYFCSGYAECSAEVKDVFKRKNLENRGSHFWSEIIPNGGDVDLSVRFGFFPSKNLGQKRLLIMSSGIHGLEGFTGSAVQRLFLEEILPDANRQNIDVLIIHGINAFGMKNYRRHTVNRVDLNRNWFVSDTFPSSLDDVVYDDFYDEFNPKGQASFGYHDFFRFVAASILPNMSSIQSGVFTKAAGQGQYRYPRGYSFGGQREEPHRAIVTTVLDKFIPNYEHVLVMDLHTGLGRRELQLLPNPPYNDRAGDLRKAVFEVNGKKIEETGGKDFYSSHGDFSDFICQYSEFKFNTSSCVNMLIEYGTLLPASWEKQGIMTSIKEYSGQAYSIYVAIRENQAFNYGAASISAGTEIRNAWTKMFNPDESNWRQMILDESRVFFPKFLERFASLP
jgi:hypothetical protein